MSSLFSIILPTYNRASLLAIAVESVVKQSYTNWELIIVNDGSTDETKAYLDGLSDKRIRVYHEKNKGQGLATNFGLELAKGEYICFLDDDDFYDLDHLSLFAKHITDKDAILRTAFRRIYPSGKIAKAELYSAKLHGNPVQFVMNHMCSVCTLAIPSSFIENHRFVDRKNWLDTYFILPLFAQHPLFQIEAHTYNYRIHDVMGSQANLKPENLESKAEDNISIIREFFDKYPDIEKKHLTKNSVKKAIAKKYAEYATTALRQKHKSLAQEFIQKSYLEHWDISLWKQYLMYYLVKFGLS